MDKRQRRLRVVQQVEEACFSLEVRAQRLLTQEVVAATYSLNLTKRLIQVQNSNQQANFLPKPKKRKCLHWPLLNKKQLLLKLHLVDYFRQKSKAVCFPRRVSQVAVECLNNLLRA